MRRGLLVLVGVFLLSFSSFSQSCNGEEKLRKGEVLEINTNSIVLRDEATGEILEGLNRASVTIKVGDGVRYILIERPKHPPILVIKDLKE